MQNHRLLSITAIVTGLALAIGTASAADIPLKARPLPPPPVVAPMYNWTGLYIGGHFGGGWARSTWQEQTVFENGFGSLCFNPFFCPFEDAGGAALFGKSGLIGSHNAIGPLGGFQAGLNWQPLGSHWVFGIEGQFSFAELKGDHPNTESGNTVINVTGPLSEVVQANGTINDRFFSKVSDIATLAARIGITSDVFDRTLFYVKGGGAWVRDQFAVTSSFTESECLIGTLSGCTSVNGTGSWAANQNRWGWMAGIGLEFGLFDNWSAKIEYDYLGFGSKNVTIAGSATGTCFNPGTVCNGTLGSTVTETFNFSRIFRIDESIQLVKLGLNYRFNWGKGKGPAPVVASY